MVIDTYRAVILFLLCTELLAATVALSGPPGNREPTVKLPPVLDVAGLTVSIRARS